MTEELNYKTMIQKDFNRLEKASLKSEDVKKKLISKLEVIINELKIDPNNSKPKKMEAQMSIINSYVSLLDSYEKQIRDTLKSKQKQQEMINVDNTGALITKLLTKISNGTNEIEKIDEKVNDAALEKAIKEKKIEVNDGEIDINAKIESLEEILSES